MSSKGTASSTGAETVGILSSDDYIDSSGTSFKAAHVSPYGLPAQLIKIASQVGSTERDYPYDGDGALDGVTNSTHVQLDDTTSGVPTDTKGMLIHFVDGAAAGETKRITAHAANHQLTLGSALTSLPTAGDHYRLLIDVFRLSQLLIKSEFSGSSATATISAAFYDYARTLAASPAFRKGIRFMDVVRDIDVIGAQDVDTEETSYYHGRVVAVDVRAALGAKIRLMSLSTGSVSLWACGI